MRFQLNTQESTSDGFTKHLTALNMYLKAIAFHSTCNSPGIECPPLQIDNPVWIRARCLEQVLPTSTGQLKKLPTGRDELRASRGRVQEKELTSSLWQCLGTGIYQLCRRSQMFCAFCTVSSPHRVEQPRPAFLLRLFSSSAAILLACPRSHSN